MFLKNFWKKVLGGAPERVPGEILKGVLRGFLQRVYKGTLEGVARGTQEVFE